MPAKYICVSFNLPRETFERLQAAAAYAGGNRTDFIKGALLAEIAEVEESKRMKRHRVLRAREQLDLRSEMPEPSAREEVPAGLGLSELLSAPRAIEAPQQVAAPQVDPISRLAEAIVARLEKKPAEPLPEERKSAAGVLFEKLSSLLP